MLMNIQLRFVVMLCLLTLGACGFHLRGMQDMPFKTLYIQKSGETPLVKDLQRSLASSGVQVVPVPENAEMLLDLMGEKTDKKILSLGGSGKVKEYELVYQVILRMRDASSEAWGAPQTVEIRRDYSYSDTQLLAKDYEESRMYSDMRADATREIMRRLNAQKPSSKPGAAN
jgi:LPS-assembly lipoprotein